MEIVETDVAIVGAGPSGLTLAVDLGRRGVRAVLVDAGTEPLPGVRAGGATTRTMEQLRRLGVADQVRARAPIPKGAPTTKVVTNGLMRDLLGTRMTRGPRLTEQSQLPVVEIQQNVPSYLMEVVLRETLEQYESVSTLYGYVSDGIVRQDENGVEITVARPVAAGHAVRIRAKYLVASDGANSAIREYLKIPVVGKRHFRTRHTVEFISPELKNLHDKGRHNQYTVFNKDIITYFVHQDPDERWTLRHEELAPEHAHLEMDPLALIRFSVGCDIPVTWARMYRWRANAFIVERQREGRVFFAGDAAHATPPGAFGLQQGISDGIDLGWKLAAVLAGWGGEALLDSYQRERWPLSRRLVAEVDTEPSNWISRMGGRDDAESLDWVIEELAARDDKQLPADHATVGYVYTDSPVLLPADGEGEGDGVRFSDSDLAEVGKRVPHRWLESGEALMDLSRGGFALLVTAGTAPDAVKYAAATGIPLRVVELGPEVMAGLLPGADASVGILVRPDDHIAWLGDVETTDMKRVLDHVVGRLQE